jgi:hypothetical protein
MQWDAVLRDSLRPAAPYVVWLGLALATSILVATIREPLCRVLREARDQLRSLRTRLLSRSTISLGRRFRRFWLLRQFEPARTVTESLDRLADTLPLVGQKSLVRVASLETDLRKQVGMLVALGMHPPSPRPSPGSQSSTTAAAPGSWWRLLVLVLIAGLTGAANSFLLNEFFQGVITSDALFPSAFPDLHVSHVFAVLIFTMEVAIGFALHHFAEDHTDGSAARRLLAMAPWLVLVGLLWLEGWAYALLSYQIDIPERLNLPASSGLYTFARYFLALFGAGLTLLLASLGYLLGKELEKLQAGSEARRQQRFQEPSGWAFHQRAEQIERTERAFARLQATVDNFQLDLVHQFKRAVETISDSQELAAAIRDAITQTLDSARRVDGTLERRFDLLQIRESRPIRTRSQSVAEMGLFTAALASLVAVSWGSGQYVAAFVRDVQGDRSSADLLALVSGVVMTGFGISAGYITGRAWGGSRYGSANPLPAGSRGRHLLQVVALVCLLAAVAGFMAIAVANHTLGAVVPLNVLFGLVHAGMLALLGAGADAAAVNTLHALQLFGLYLERLLVSLVALGLWLLQALLAMLDWSVRIVAVFGQLVVRPRPPVRVGAAQVSRGSGVPRELRSPARRFSDKAYGPVSRSEHA